MSKKLYDGVVVTGIWPIDAQHYLVKNTYAPARKTLSNVSVWDTENNTRTDLWTAEAGFTIQDIVSTPNYYYWSVNTDVLMPEDTAWKIYQYDRATKKTRVVLSYENYPTTSLPRLTVYGETLLFVSHEQDAEENDVHYAVQWDAETETARKLFKLCRVVNAFTRMVVDGDDLYINDYTSQGVILRYNLKTNELAMFQPELQYEDENIFRIAVTENAIYYSTNHNMLYVRAASEEKARAVLSFPFSIGSVGNQLVFTHAGMIYCLPDGSDTYYKLTEDRTKEGYADYFFFPLERPIIYAGLSYVDNGATVTEPLVYQYSES